MKAALCRRPVLAKRLDTRSSLNAFAGRRSQAFAQSNSDPPEQSLNPGPISAARRLSKTAPHDQEKTPPGQAPITPVRNLLRRFGGSGIQRAKLLRRCMEGRSV